MCRDGTGGIAGAELKEVLEFDGQAYVLERAIRTDFALVHARFGDQHGNLVCEKAAENGDPLCARRLVG